MSYRLATLIKKALDTGASSLMIPNINSAQMARDVVYNAKYSPLGMRGACPGVRANYYGKEGVEYYPRANRETAIMLQVEGKQGVEEFDQILEVEGVDAINLGPVDLSMALGVPGDVNHPLVISTMKEMVKKCKARGVKVGTFCMDPVNARKWLDEGMDIIEYHIDTMLMRAAVSGAVEEFKKLLG